MVGEVELAELMEWAAGEGITDAPPHSPNSSCLGHSLAISDFPSAGGRGFKALRPLKRGDLILKVPTSALLTTDAVSAADDALSRALHKHPSLVPSQVRNYHNTPNPITFQKLLSVCLLREHSKGKGSKWHTYLTTIPRRYHLLASFTDSDIQALQVEDAVYAAQKSRKAAESQWRGAVAVLEELGMRKKYRSYGAWSWANGTVSSRTMHIPWDKAGCLCPVGDFFNYEAPCEDDEGATEGGYEEENGAYCFYARRDYREGEQVMLCYGTYTNLELLEHYGFVLEGNPCDKVFIPLDGMMETLAWPRDSLFIHGSGRPSFALAAELRRSAAVAAERKSIGCLVVSGGLVSAENEIRVLRWLGEKCSLVMSGFGSSLEEDERLLGELGEAVDGSDSVERLKLAVRLRMGHKKAILNCVVYCREFVGSLQRELISNMSAM